jgi:putative membrane protein
VAQGAQGRAGASSVRPEKLRLIKKLLHGEMLAIVIILLCAAIMARGGWV